MTIADTTGSDDYRKSSYSTDDNCVEVRRDLAGARDSKNGERLEVPMAAFVAAIAGDRIERTA